MFASVSAALRSSFSSLKRAPSRNFRILTVTMAAAHVSATGSASGVSVKELPVVEDAVRAQLSDRLQGAFYGLLIGDALSAPVHWYYNPADIAREFGTIRDFHKPKASHPSSILSLSSTGGAGRGDQKGNIIGDVINHGKKELWLRPGSHYHGTLARGENTLNAQVARLLVRTVAAEGSWSPGSFLAAYVKFMTTPGSHNDTYAETYHRMFFKNWVAGKPPAKCADDDGHNVASMGGFVLLPPVALFSAVQELRRSTTAAAAAAAAPLALPLVPAPEAVVKAAVEATVAQMYCTHNSPELERFARVYAALLARVLLGADLRTAVAEAGKSIGVDLPGLAAKHGAGPATAVVGRVFSSACYIEHSFPSLLYLAYVHAADPEAALVANTNAGGENCHRGSALGALMGAAHGMKAWPARWADALVPAAAIREEADSFVGVALGAAAGASAGGAGAPAVDAPAAAVAVDAKGGVGGV